MTRLTSSKWFLPASCVAVGVAFFAAASIGGNLREGVYALLLMTVLGIAVLLGGRSETVRGLRGDERDERFRTIDVHAGALTGFVLIVTLVILALTRIAQGEDIDPYGRLLAVGGLTYVVALVYMHRRG